MLEPILLIAAAAAEEEDLYDEDVLAEEAGIGVLGRRLAGISKGFTRDGDILLVEPDAPVVAVKNGF